MVLFQGWQIYGMRVRGGKRKIKIFFLSYMLYKHIVYTDRYTYYIIEHYKI